MGIVIRYTGVGRGGATEEAVRQLAADLESVYDRIARCDVVVEALRGHQLTTHRYRVRVSMTVPGGEIVVSRDPAPGVDQEDPLVALRDSFSAARRRLEHYVWRNLRDDHVAPRSTAHG
jgi:hypothetical protein